VQAVVAKYQKLLLHVVSICANFFLAVQCKYYLRANIIDDGFKLKNKPKRDPQCTVKVAMTLAKTHSLWMNKRQLEYENRIESAEKHGAVAAIKSKATASKIRKEVNGASSSEETQSQFEHN
jgi:hypothetical protein